MTIDQIVGSIGVSILLLAYALNVLGKIEREGKMYAGLNAVGAALACVASWMIEYYPFVVLEGVWTLVSLVALVSGKQKNHGA